jgi:hypothetical protein
MHYIFLMTNYVLPYTCVCTHTRISGYIIHTLAVWGIRFSAEPKTECYYNLLINLEIKYVNGQRGISSGKNHEKPVNISGQKLSRTRGAKKA